MQEVEAIFDLITGQAIEDATNQAIIETIDSLCEADPNYPCEQMKGYYGVYVGIKGAKDLADDIAIWK